MQYSHEQQGPHIPACVAPAVTMSSSWWQCFLFFFFFFFFIKCKLLLFSRIWILCLFPSLEYIQKHAYSTAHLYHICLCIWICRRHVGPNYNVPDRCSVVAFCSQTNVVLTSLLFSVPWQKPATLSCCKASAPAGTSFPIPLCFNAPLEKPLRDEKNTIKGFFLNPFLP